MKYPDNFKAKCRELFPALSPSVSGWLETGDSRVGEVLQDLTVACPTDPEVVQEAAGGSLSSDELRAEVADNICRHQLYEWWRRLRAEQPE